MKRNPPTQDFLRWMELALLVFSGSLVLKVEVSHLRTTEKKMQHDSTIPILLRSI
jgi:hypothetical protein